MKLSTKLAIVVASAPFLAHCAVEVRTPRVYVPPPPPPPTVQVDVAAVPPPPPQVDVAAVAPTDYADNDPSALTDFHSALDSHGQWVEDSKYGTVWVPNPAEVGPDFVPYSTGGHWAYGDDYTWVSDYDWGWAPFHYGRWVSGDQGWSWIPGRTYAPAWVSWSTGDPSVGYVGWAPAAPEFYWRGGSYVAVDWVVEPRWGYARSGDLFEAHLGGRMVRGSAAASFAGRMHPYGGGVAGGGGAVHGHAAGPAPTSIGVNPSKIVHPSATDPGLAKAKGFSNPTTAASLGGHPPAIRNNGQIVANHPVNTGAATNTAQGFHGQTVTSGRMAPTTTTTTTTTTAAARAGANTPAIHEQGAAAATHATVPATRPTATAPTSTPPSHGGGRKK
jgi:hypothetical protein